MLAGAQKVTIIAALARSGRVNFLGIHISPYHTLRQENVMPET
ncbi:Hypothetical protein, conserved [Brucella abortus str. 2308 A]|uniref:Uncharacterized protein n=2 Tax=Brucella TaxID=234 RepID=A0A0H3AQ83_BRUO2|nr:hypothetical protein BOV_1162 [Brucella ovis ATCC 25840]ADZ66284.1 conserved hypothetical protein [Brucella melitensis M28]ADZ87142.1 conserved hypothetical protein [Brucella melitensis M5-90]AEQ08788.1 hypothetical protein BMNI_I1167 [Brucella melitensis NI]AEW15053.1 hypothetical protein BCA52141_I3259 [Brucella canis HSK A52141]AEW17648.1 hypothetical protein BAA13334_I02058 [Brucella abortus A13334]AIB17933.1 Hypothetical protein BSSP3_I1216 [Brucella suis bv. 2]EEH14719.1 Hypothetica